VADPDPVVLPLFRAPVRKQNAAYRDNMARLEVAALVADTLSAPLVLAEGWKSNDRGDGILVDGTDTAQAMLDDMGLPKLAEVIHLHASCCTWQEFAVVHETFPGRPIIALAGSACPSVRRAQRVCRVQGLAARVYAPCEALEVFKIESGFRAPRAGYSDVLCEGINWLVHGISSMEKHWEDPFEFRLARRLRDHAP
jgi:hypothetical protein